MPRAVIYTRVSSLEQVNNYSLRTQERECRRYCDPHGLEVDRVFVEKGESAKTTERPVFQAMLEYLRKGKKRVSTLVVHNVSRLARKRYDHEVVKALLSEMGISLRSVTEPIDDSPTGRAMEGMLATFAQLDNDIRSERTVSGMRAALEQGRWTFLPPLGFMKPPPVPGMPSMVEDPDRGPFITEAFELVATGHFSIRQALQRITEKGLRTKKGAPVSPQSMGSILRNPLYAGIIDLPRMGVRCGGDFKPLVDEDIFLRVQRVINKKSVTRVPRSRFHPDFPLRAFVECTMCGTPLTGSWSKGRNKKYGYYFCHNRSCGQVRAPKEVVESAFAGLLSHLQPKPEYIALFKEVVLNVWNRRSQEQHQRAARLNDALVANSEKRNLLVEAFIYEHRIDQSTYEAQIERLDQSREKIELELGNLATDDLDVESIFSFTEQALSNASPMWVDLSSDRKRCFQRVLFPDGVHFDGYSIRTDSTSSIFSYLGAVSNGEEKVVTPTGFEPVSPA